MVILTGGLTAIFWEPVHDPGDTRKRDLTTSESELLAAAEWRLVRDCVIEQGIAFDASQGQPESAGRVEDGHRYVIDDVEWAARHGFGIRSSPHPIDVLGSSASDEDSLNESIYLALHGGPDAHRVGVTLPNGMRISTSTEGCVGQARELLYGDLRVWLPTEYEAVTLASVVESEVRADNRYRGAVRKWSQCIGRLGHDVDDPDHLREIYVRQWQHLDTDGTKEREMAVQEATCARSTRMGSTLADLESEIAARVSGDRSGLLERYRSLRLAALPAATNVMVGPITTTQHEEEK